MRASWFVSLWHGCSKQRMERDGFCCAHSAATVNIYLLGASSAFSIVGVGKWYKYIWWKRDQIFNDVADQSICFTYDKYQVWRHLTWQRYYPQVILFSLLSAPKQGFFRDPGCYIGSPNWWFLGELCCFDLVRTGIWLDFNESVLNQNYEEKHDCAETSVAN